MINDEENLIDQLIYPPSNPILFPTEIEKNIILKGQICQVKINKKLEK